MRLCGSFFFVCGAVGASLRQRKPANTSDVPAVPKSLNATGFTLATETGMDTPCKCTSYSTWWKKPSKRKPECLFFDLGAADGETYKAFLGKSSKWTFNYDTGSYPKDKCFAYLVEANPEFSDKLEALRSERVYPMVKQAAYMCDKDKQDFWLDQTSEGSATKWGSSLNFTHQSVINKQGSRKSVSVELYNLMRLLQENALPEDNVIVKMDIEGAEYDILPCLADAPAAELIDTLYLEDHCTGRHWCPTTGQAGNSKATFAAAVEKLKKRGVKVPEGYWSPML